MNITIMPQLNKLYFQTGVVWHLHSIFIYAYFAVFRIFRDGLVHYHHTLSSFLSWASSQTGIKLFANINKKKHWSNYQPVASEAGRHASFTGITGMHRIWTAGRHVASRCDAAACRSRTAGAEAVTNLFRQRFPPTPPFAVSTGHMRISLNCLDRNSNVAIACKGLLNTSHRQVYSAVQYVGHALW